MLEKIRKTLNRNQDIKAWIICHENTRGTQQYDLQKSTESIRDVSSELFTIDILCDTPDGEGKTSSGLGTVSILPGGEIDQALEKAVITAKLVHNEPYDFAEPTPLPKIDLFDNDYLNDPNQALQGVLKSLKEITANYPHVRLTGAEIYGQEKDLHLVSSKGIDALQKSTDLYLEWVFIGGKGNNEVETFADFYRRRIVDLHLEEEVALRAQYTTDLLNTEPPQDYSGPVVVKGDSLSMMLAGEVVLSGSVIQVLSAGASKYSGETPWEIGKSIFRSEVNGDPFNAWANRSMPYGMESSSFDKEGIPAQRVSLIRDNMLESFITNQRFSQYLNVPATGAFGNLEVPAGKASLTELEDGSYVEIAKFAWFRPNFRTGDFSSEIRLGYIVNDGEKKPFKGGLLVGNLLDALADVHWSAETGFYGNYQGPMAARFNNLKVAGE